MVICRFWNKATFIALVWGALSHFGWAQTPVTIDTAMPPNRIIHFDADNGLLQNTVRKMIFDNQGFLWIVSEKGLSRYDGTNFRHYRNNDYEAELVGERFTSLSPSGDCYYINDRNMYVSNGKMTIVEVEEYRGPSNIGMWEQGLSPSNFHFEDSDAIRAIRRTPDPYKGEYGIFFRVNDREVYGANFKGGLDYLVDGKKVSELPMEYEYTYEFDTNKTVAVELINNLQAYYRRYFVQGESLFFMAEDGQLKEYRKGKLHQIYKTDLNSTSLEVIWGYGQPVFIRAGADIYRFGYSDGPVLNIEVRLPEVIINSIVWNEEQDVLFIGTNFNGLYEVRTRYFFPGYCQEAGSWNNERSLFEIGRDSVLTSKGLIHTPYASYDIRDELIDFELEDELALYATQSFKGRLDPVGKCFPHGSEPSWWAGNYIRDSEGNIWYAGRDGLIAIEEGECRLKLEDKRPQIKDFLGSFYDPFRDVVWRTFKKRMDFISLEDYKMNEIPELQDLAIRNVYFESADRAWLCVVGKGLYLWINGKLTHFPMDNKRSLGSCHAILEDDKGYFWLSTDNGLIRASKEELLNFVDNSEANVYYHHFDKNSGFLTNEFNGGGFPCGLRLSSGLMAFPSLKGVVTFRPDEVRIPSAGSGLFLDQVMVDRRDTITQTGLQLDQNFDQLEFQLLMAYFGDPVNLNLEYRVSGLHETWHPVPQDRRIILNELNYGDYELQVRRKDGSGIDNYSYLSHTLTVSKRYYQTTLFQIGSVLLISLLIGLLFLFRSRLARAQRLKLERVIEEKTHDLLILNEELKLNLARVRESREELRQNNRLRDKILAIYTHDIRGPLRFIQTIAGKSMEKLDSIDKEEMHTRLNDINESTGNIYGLTERMFQWMRADPGEFSLQPEELDLAEFLEEIVLSFQGPISAKGLELKAAVAPGTSLITERNVLSIVLNNLIDNSIKFTEKGSITISAQPLKDHVVISIVDTGKGIKDLEKLRKAVFQGDQEINREKGFGLRAIQELLMKLGGYLEIESEVGKGTHVSVFLRKF